MKQKKTTVIFGGSFNPPLNSHFSIAQEVLNQFEEVEKIVFMPVSQKYSKYGLIENEHRYNMLKLVANKNSRFMVSDLDFYGEESLTSIEILEGIRKQFPEDEICFLMGSDNLKDLHNWKRPEEIVSKYKILVMERDGDDIDEIIKNDRLLRCYKENFWKLNEEIKSNYSSTYVRSQLRKGKSVRYLLPDEVFEYILANKLYRGESYD